MSKLLRAFAFTFALPAALFYWPSACANRSGPAASQMPGSMSSAAEPASPASLGFSGILPHPSFAYAQGGASPTVSIADIAEATTPSVVAVMSERVAKAGPQIPFFFGPPEFHGRERKQQGVGSGVIVSADGVVLTNNHVVEEATKVIITLTDGRELSAKVLGTDEKSDLAVLQIQGKPAGLKPIPFGDSSNLRLGDVVLAIGNPFGVGQTVTMGIVSAKGRADVGIVDYEDFIQTDAAINPGNSGGALVNTRGELVGINTAILSRSGGYQGIGFAIPSNMARPIMKSLQEDGRVSRGFLGVGIQDLTPDIAAAMGLKIADGVLITEVQPDGAAARAGVKRGDIVLKIGGQSLKSTGQMRNLIASSGANSTVTLTIHRGDQILTLKVQLAELPGQESSGSKKAPETPGSTLGMELSQLTPKTAARLGLDPKASAGKVVVTRVDPDTPAAEAGLRPGDLLLEVDRHPVKAVAAAQKALAGQGPVLLLIERGGTSRFVALKRER